MLLMVIVIILIMILLGLGSVFLVIGASYRQNPYLQQLDDEAQEETLNRRREWRNQKKAGAATPSKGKTGRGKIPHWKIITLCLMAYDIVAANASYAIALWMRFDGSFSAIPTEYEYAYLKFIPFCAVGVVAVFSVFRLYRCIWRFVGFDELVRLVEAWGVLTLLQCLGITLFIQRMPISYYIIGAILQFFFLSGIRFSYRIILKWMSGRRANDSSLPWKNVMIIGAGEAGEIILKDVRKTTAEHIHVACMIDDNPNKWNRYVEGVPVVGGREDILLNAEKYHIQQILYAIPSATAETKREILNICKETDCEIKVLPGIYQFVTNEVSLKRMRDVSIEDLLGREPIRVNMDGIFSYIKGKTILVTGGGGSIGSELCRQIAKHSPKQLVIFDIYENNAYSIEQELRANYQELNLTVLIGSVRDSRRINWVFEHYRPEIVYHAAAHKHVPLMETSPNEAIKNNVVGTYKTACAALMYGCQRFVLVSTDKAVNPTNIMGASKRLCEMVVQSIDAVSKSGAYEKLPNLNAHDGMGNCSGHQHGQKPKIQQPDGKRTEFVAVRFGNVLGSNGSVIPLFRKQIEKGGPITVTHPDIIRYFMTIPEAVSLVMEAGTYAKGGEIFVLDMGSPMKIDTLARNLIRLSGYKPDVDIKITYTGLRPGEKLYEEKLMAEEGMEKTANDLIHIGKPIAFDMDRFFAQLKDLAEASYENRDDIVHRVEGVVSTFHPVGDHKQ